MPLREANRKEAAAANDAQKPIKTTAAAETKAIEIQQKWFNARRTINFQQF
jgi:hypothetical protein